MKKSGNIIGVNFGITLNLGDYNSVRFDAWLQKEINEKDDIQAKFDSLWKIVDKEIQEKIGQLPLFKERNLSKQVSG